jgi:predicted CXXCH cytochrome family protein
MNKRTFTESSSLIRFTQFALLTGFTGFPNLKSQGNRVNPSNLLNGIFIFIVVFTLISGVAYAESPMKENIPGMCYKCHPKVKDELLRQQVHFPFREGKCIACHDSHAGNMKGLVKEEISTLCLSCHEKVQKSLDKRFVHNAIRKGVCTDCHYAHSGEYPKLLVKNQKDLCWNCHEALSQRLKNAHVHVPFNEGKCSACHEPHASAEENLMLGRTIEVCKTCHAVKCTVNGISIARATEKIDCIQCHTGHASPYNRLLGPCGHKAFLEEKCETCHNPMTVDAKITTKISGQSLCISCHKLDPAKLKGDDVHTKEAKGGCTLCHNRHASKSSTFTVKASLICFTCHENTEKRTMFMEKAFKSIRCIPVRERKCFACHIPPHSQNSLYFPSDPIKTCARCHVSQHKVAHPLGPNVKDPRNGQPITCITCHSMHSARAEFMLSFDRKRQLCIQCHKK